MSRPAIPPLDLVALAVAPALMGVAMLLDLTPSADGTAELLALVEAKPARWMWSNAVFLFAGVTWTAAAVGLWRRLGRRSRPIAVGALALAAGGAALGLIEATMAYLPSLSRSSVPVAVQVTVVEHLDASVPAMVYEIVHIIGWLGGLLLVAAGLFSTQVVPRWVPGALLAGLAGVVVFVAGPGLALASAVMTAATTALAVRLAQYDRPAASHEALPSTRAR